MLRTLLRLVNLYNLLRIKILPLADIDKNLPEKGKIVDLGCGDGFISKYLSQVKTRAVIGIDINKERLSQSPSNNLKFIEADIRQYSFKDIDGIIISDVLHHLNFATQEQILEKVARNLKKNGVLIIKEIDTTEFLRSRLSRLWDLVFYPKDKIYYWRGDNLRKTLETFGFKVKIIRASRLFPGSTTLFICRK